MQTLSLCNICIVKCERVTRAIKADQINPPRSSPPRHLVFHAHLHFISFRCLLVTYTTGSASGFGSLSAGDISPFMAWYLHKFRATLPAPGGGTKRDRFHSLQHYQCRRLLSADTAVEQERGCWQFGRVREHPGPRTSLDLRSVALRPSRICP